MVPAILLSLLVAGCVIVPISWPSPPGVRQAVYRKGRGFSPAKIAVIDVSGVLTGGSSGSGLFTSDSTVVDFTRKLRNVKNDGRVEAVILRMDTPGGGVTASDIMYHELSEFRDETNLPVYISMQTVAASGGYYLSMAADRIYATPTSITGSIGVIATFPEARDLMNKIGLGMNAIKTGPNKDAGAFYRTMRPEDRELYQAVVDDMYGKFIAAIEGNRTDLGVERIRELADGRIYTAQQALDAGLIDGIAYLDEVVETVERDLGLSRPEVVIIKRSGSDTTTSLYAREAALASQSPASGNPATQINLLHVDMSSWSTPTNEVFNYLWVP